MKKPSKIHHEQPRGLVAGAFPLLPSPQRQGARRSPPPSRSTPSGLGMEILGPTGKERVPVSSPSPSSPSSTHLPSACMGSWVHGLMSSWPHAWVHEVGALAAAQGCKGCNAAPPTPLFAAPSCISPAVSAFGNWHVACTMIHHHSTPCRQIHLLGTQESVLCRFVGFIRQARSPRHSPHIHLLQIYKKVAHYLTAFSSLNIMSLFLHKSRLC